jgi:predicted membrane GTPase involved in stress response
MQDFYKSYDSLAEAAQEIFEANTSDYEKKYGGRILQKLSKRKGKLVTIRLTKTKEPSGSESFHTRIQTTSPDILAFAGKIFLL